jgi:hypothetical protein
MRVKANAFWKSLPAILSTNYWVHCSFVLLHGVNVTSIIHETGAVKKTRDTLWHEWGQSANLIVAVVAIFHVFYSYTRLFTAETLSERARVADGAGYSDAWASPLVPLLTAHIWKPLNQRFPFGKLQLDYSDHLLLDDATLKSTLDPLPEQDQKIREQLWRELLAGFEWNDPEGILDSLKQGAPVDRLNNDGDYPIHQAARLNNMDILAWTCLTRKDGGVSEGCLLLPNSAGATPLEVAVQSSTLEAVRWIMERLPQSRTEAKEAVYRAFNWAIDTQREGILKIIQHHWPSWTALEIPGRDGVLSPIPYSVQRKKERSTDALVSIVLRGYDPKPSTSGHYVGSHVFSTDR